MVRRRRIRAAKARNARAADRAVRLTGCITLTIMMLLGRSTCDVIVIIIAFHFVSCGCPRACLQLPGCSSDVVVHRHGGDGLNLPDQCTSRCETALICPSEKLVFLTSRPRSP